MSDNQEVARIVDQVQRVFSGEAWHGANLMSILQQVDPSLVFEEAYEGGNSIWRLVAHLATWFDVAIRRIDGEEYDPPRKDDFPDHLRQDQEEWEEQLSRLKSEYERFVNRVSLLTDKELEKKVAGIGYPTYHLLHGIVQHMAYHAGQIAVVARTGKG